MEKGLFYALMLMLLLFFSSPYEEAAVMVAEAGRTCESQSHGFKGKCLSDHNCGLVCRNEGFTDGWCRGFRRRCFCTKHC